MSTIISAADSGDMRSLNKAYINSDSQDRELSGDADGSFTRWRVRPAVGSDDEDVSDSSECSVGRWRSRVRAQRDAPPRDSEPLRSSSASGANRAGGFRRGDRGRSTSGNSSRDHSRDGSWSRARSCNRIGGAYRDRMGFLQCVRIMREPIHPLTHEEEIRQIQAWMPGGLLSAGARRRLFRITNHRHLQESTQRLRSMSGPTRGYSRDFLLRCSESAAARLAPPRWDARSRAFPDVCRQKNTVTRYFDPNLLARCLWNTQTESGDNRDRNKTHSEALDNQMIIEMQSTSRRRGVNAFCALQSMQGEYW